MTDITNLISEEISKAEEELGDPTEVETDPDPDPEEDDGDDDSEQDDESESEGGDEEESFKIPGVGDFTLDEIKGALDAKGRLAEVEARVESRELDREQMAEAETLQSLVNMSSAFRDDLQALVEKHSKLGPSKSSDGTPNKLDLSGIKDPRVDQLLKEIEPLRATVVRQQTQELLAEHDAMRDGYIKRFDGIMTRPVWDGMVQDLMKEKGSALSFKDIEFSANKYVADNGIKAAREGALADAAKKGSRLLVRSKSKEGVAATPPSKVNTRDFHKILVPELNKKH
jgi:hypothetical protein